jgi:hypothetical protein
MPYYNYNNPNPYNSNLPYDGFYLNASVSGILALTATAITHNVFINTVSPIAVNTAIASARTPAGVIFTSSFIQVSGGILPATGFTHPVGFLSGTSINAPLSTASVRTWPIQNAQEAQVERIRLYNGYPRPQDVALARNRKVTVVGGKLGYQLTGKFWTTKL